MTRGRVRMRIVENDQGRLVLRDRTYWITYACCGASLFDVFFALKLGDPRALMPAALFGLFGLAFLRSSDVIFDRGTRVCTIRRRDLWRVKHQEIPFGDISGVDIDTRNIDTNYSVISCRMSLRTNTGALPLTASYEPSLDEYRAMRQSILATVCVERPHPSEYDEVRSLADVGRTVDAVSVLRSRDPSLSLGDAVARAKSLD